jgi:hypothetical protein
VRRREGFLLLLSVGRPYSSFDSTPVETLAATPIRFSPIPAAISRVM